jgi:NADH-quinone oxidoreductase subunit K
VRADCQNGFFFHTTGQPQAGAQLFEASTPCNVHECSLLCALVTLFRPKLTAAVTPEYDCLSFHYGLAEQSHPLVFSNMLFIVGAVGFMSANKNVLFLLLCTELLFLSSALNFIFCSVYTANTLGQLFALLVFVVAAAEASLGLSVVVLVTRTRSAPRFEDLCLLRG